MQSPTRTILRLALGLVLLSTACSPASTSTPAQPQPAATLTNATSASATAALYSDPFAYCAAVGTLDTPDARYNGPAMPDAVVQALIRQGVVSASAPADFQKAGVWRCMDGQVWACLFGANLPCQEKADTSRQPTSAMNDFCTANPSADSIPAAVTGRATVYEWKCADGKAAVVQQSLQVDARGYLADFWHQLSPK